MGLFDSAKVKKGKIINGLLNSEENHDMVSSLTTLQNEISVSFNTKVIAITSIDDDELAAAFAKAFASAFSNNGSSSLIIDGNLYNPCLEKTINKSNNEESDVYVKDDKESDLTYIDKRTEALCLSKVIYPSEMYKSGAIQKIIKENEGKFEHFIVLTPSVKDHKEIVLLNDVLESVILVTQKNVTIKEHIFNAIAFFSENKLPLAKTVILK